MDSKYITDADIIGLGEGIMFDRTRRQESDVGFEAIRSEYRDESSARNSV